MRHYVVRKYSGVTAQKVLIKVESRGFTAQEDADEYADTLRIMNPRKKYFVLALPEELGT